MIELYGIKESYSPHPDGETTTEEERNLIATFDTEQQAEDFVESCKRKTPIRNSWTNDEPFKINSLLDGYGWVEIKKRVHQTIPHNPGG